MNSSTKIVVAVLMGFGVALLFGRLDDRLLWQDEAETALLARSVLVHGVPTAFDGRNLISQEGQAEFSAPDYRWFWTPWLQHYAAAASFAVFGESTFSARLPFVLFAIGTFWLCLRLAREVDSSAWVAAAALMLLVTSVPFLLHGRQCRYYAPASFFGLLYLLEYLRLLHRAPGDRVAALRLALAATGLFHSHYVACAGFLIGSALHALYCSRAMATSRTIRARLPALAGAVVIMALLTLPFAWAFAGHASGQAWPGLGRALTSLSEAVYHVDRYVFPLVLMLPAAFFWARDRRGHDAGRVVERPERSPDSDRMHGQPVVVLLVLVMLATVLLLVATMPWFFFRYYVPLIPIAAILQARVVSRVWRFDRRLGAVLLALLALTDLPSRVLPLPHHIPAKSVRHLRTGDEEAAAVVGTWARYLPLSAYLYEITHEQRGPIEAVVDHLVRHARPDQSILATYGDLPLQFYTELDVVGGLSGEDPARYVRADWLLVRAHTHRAGDRRLKRFVAKYVDRAAYEAIDLPVLDEPYENRPDPTYHKFRQPSAGLPAVRLWRRVSAD